MKKILLLFAAVAAAAFAGCNTDNVIYGDALPEITLDRTDGAYTVKVGEQLTIAPTIANAEGAACEWILGSELVGTEPSHTFIFDEAKTWYVTFRVTTAAGSASVDMSIESVELAIPVISLALPAGDDGVLRLLTGSEFTFRPVIKHTDAPGFSCEWLLEGTKVSDGLTYTFSRNETGRCSLTVRTATEDGTDSREIAIEVVSELPQSVRFPQQSYMQPSTDRSTVIGRPLYLSPLLENFDSPHFVWSVDGAEQKGSDNRMFRFTPDRAGDYRIGVDVSDGSGASVHAEVTVHCAASVAGRPKTAVSRPVQNRVYEYIPAPGQYINDRQAGGFDSDITTHDEATAYAEVRLGARKFVSLGGFGGYIIVGFDHSIVASGGQYDFAIQGNAFLSTSGGSNEPGIVWVMQDTNGNGLPDDEWYELRGSESGADDTIYGYEVTYYRPEAPRMSVQWRDSEGAEGVINYMNAFHRQDWYYPAWVGADAYTLRGTRLAARNSEDSSGLWHNNACEWGYADNYGSDNLSSSVGAGGEGQRTGFRIANAMNADGSAAGLEFIDFVKVQTAMNTSSGALGENSTEVFSFDDLSMEQ